jgi:adenylate cyclase
MQGKAMLRLYISGQKEAAQFEHQAGPLEIGREPREGNARRVIHDPYMSADQLRVEELPGGRVRLENLSRKVPVNVADGTVIEAGKTGVLTLPARLSVGTTLIQIDLVVSELSRSGSASSSAGSLMTIAKPIQSIGPVRTLGMGSRLNAEVASGLSGDVGGLALESSPDIEQLARWFETVVAIQKAAAGSAGFYQEIAQAVVDLIGLDCGVFLLRRNNTWQEAARATRPDVKIVEISDTILDRVCHERRTYYQSSGLGNSADSLAGIKTVVASPVLDAAGEAVRGAVYGVRMYHDDLKSAEIRPLHAQLVQVMATAAAAGIARLEMETEAARLHVQFEQFFSRELAGELGRNPELLVGQDREVTILVSDVRKFSWIAERLGPRPTCQLMGDVLECLTSQIHKEGGVVVDYVGDGIMAMWNAPVLQPDHALRACRAALAMLGELPGLNARWAQRIGTDLALGIGLNTGEALVGNTGSRQRLKYGPLGNTVNLASRVEGATKPMGVPVLVTGSTHAKVQGSFACRRLCKVRVVGIDKPVDLFELYGTTTEADEGWLRRRDAYEQALRLYEQNRLSDACRALFPLLEGPEGQHDKAALTLAARAIEGIRSGVEIDPIINLDFK